MRPRLVLVVIPVLLSWAGVLLGGLADFRIGLAGYRITPDHSDNKDKPPVEKSQPATQKNRVAAEHPTKVFAK
jgi:hypothetical protein